MQPPPGAPTEAAAAKAVPVVPPPVVGQPVVGHPVLVARRLVAPQVALADRRTVGVPTDAARAPPEAAILAGGPRIVAPARREATILAGAEPEGAPGARAPQGLAVDQTPAARRVQRARGHRRPAAARTRGAQTLGARTLGVPTIAAQTRAGLAPPGRGARVVDRAPAARGRRARPEDAAVRTPDGGVGRGRRVAEARPTPAARARCGVRVAGRAVRHATAGLGAAPGVIARQPAPRPVAWIRTSLTT